MYGLIALSSLLRIILKDLLWKPKTNHFNNKIVLG